MKFGLIKIGQRLRQNLSQTARKYWHEVFYKHASKERVEFALTCRNFTAAIDLHEIPKTRSDRFRFFLHLSLCQACKNYYDLSSALSNAVKKVPPASPQNLEHINKSLLLKYSVKNDVDKPQ